MKKKTTVNNKINIGKAILKTTSQLNPDEQPGQGPNAGDLAVWEGVQRHGIRKHFKNEYEEISTLPLDEIIQATNNYISHYRDEVIRHIINQRYRTYDIILKYKKLTDYQKQTVIKAQDKIESEIEDAGSIIEYLQSIRDELTGPAPDIEVDLIIKLIDRITEVQAKEKKTKIDFSYTDKMKSDLQALADNKIIQLAEDRPIFKDKHYAVCLFDLWHENYYIQDYESRKNEIISANIFFKKSGKTITVGNLAKARSDIKNKNYRHTKDILKFLPHLKKNL